MSVSCFLGLGHAGVLACAHVGVGVEVWRGASCEEMGEMGQRGQVGL